MRIEVINEGQASQATQLSAINTQPITTSSSLNGIIPTFNQESAVQASTIGTRDVIVIIPQSAIISSDIMQATVVQPQTDPNAQQIQAVAQLAFLPTPPPVIIRENPIPRVIRYGLPIISCLGLSVLVITAYLASIGPTRQHPYQERPSDSTENTYRKVMGISGTIFGVSIFVSLLTGCAVSGLNSVYETEDNIFLNTLCSPFFMLYLMKNYCCCRC